MRLRLLVHLRLLHWELTDRWTNLTLSTGVVKVVRLGYLAAAHVLRHGGETTLLHRQLAHTLVEGVGSGSDAYHGVVHVHLSSILLLNRLILAIDVDLRDHFLNKSVQLIHLMLMAVNLRNYRLQRTLNHLMVSDILRAQTSYQLINFITDDFLLHLRCLFNQIYRFLLHVADHIRWREFFHVFVIVVV